MCQWAIHGQEPAEQLSNFLCRGVSASLYRHHRVCLSQVGHKLLPVAAARLHKFFILPLGRLESRMGLAGLNAGVSKAGSFRWLQGRTVPLLSSFSRLRAVPGSDLSSVHRASTVRLSLSLCVSLVFSLEPFLPHMCIPVMTLAHQVIQDNLPISGQLTSNLNFLCKQ